MLTPLARKGEAKHSLIALARAAALPVLVVDSRMGDGRVADSRMGDGRVADSRMGVDRGAAAHHANTARRALPVFRR